MKPVLWILGIGAGIWVSSKIARAGSSAVDNWLSRKPEQPGGYLDRHPGLHTPGFFIESGVASWYGPGYAGKLTANGEKFNPSEMTAAHKTLPFGTMVKVLDNETGKSVIVRINDRGPFVEGRVIDLSEGAAIQIGIKNKGLASVSLSVA